MDRVIIGIHTQLLSKQCCFTRFSGRAATYYRPSVAYRTCKDQSLAVGAVTLALESTLIIGC